MTEDERLFLAARGWDMSAPFDLCWLDHDSPVPGYRKAAGSREICLCPEDALYLEGGELEGDYDGALLPPESRATEWPWLPAGELSYPVS